jgi:nitronate monooxygenase
VLAASATNLAEARAIAAAGLDLIMAQGWEAGGHRGHVRSRAPDAPVRWPICSPLVLRECSLPVVAAGGLMDGHGVRAVLAAAMAAQLGTAFIGCPKALRGPAIVPLAPQHGAGNGDDHRDSGRPARCLANGFTALENLPPVPDYPRPYDAGKALDAAALAQGEEGFGAQWAGMGAARARPCQLPNWSRP